MMYNNGSSKNWGETQACFPEWNRFKHQSLFVILTVSVRNRASFSTMFASSCCAHVDSENGINSSLIQVLSDIF